MKNVDIISRVVARKGETISSSSKGAQKNDFSDYLLKSIWDKVFELKTDSQGIDYIFSKLPVVTQYGITMYSGDGVDIPSLASGLPFDRRTIWYNPDTNQIEVIGGTGGGSGEGVSNFWDLSGIPSWITISKPKYTYSEIEGTPDLSVFATQDWIISQGYASAEELKKYIPISGYTEVSGEKNFVGGLKVNGSPIYYDTEKKYWKLEGDLLVTGGVTMYGVDSADIPSLIKSLPVASTKEKGVAYFDPDFFSVSSDGKVSFIGETVGGLDIVSLQNYLTQNSYLNATEGDNRYLKLSGGTIYGKLNVTDRLVLNNGNALQFIDAENKVSRLLYPAMFNDYDLSYHDGTSWRRVWDSGNDGANSGLDADLLDGQEETTFAKWKSGISSSDEYRHIGYAFRSKGWKASGAAMSFGADKDYFMQIQGVGSENKDVVLYARYIYEGIYSDWKTIAFTDSNVASATTVMMNYSYNQDVNYPLVFTSRDNIGVTQNATLYIDFSGRPTYNPKTDTLTVGNLSGNATYATNSSKLYSTDSIYSYGSSNPYYGYLTYNQTYGEWDFKVSPNTPEAIHVYSSDKLRTARTIWGQSFDGTGNVTGNLSDVSNIYMSGAIVGVSSIYDNTTDGFFVGSRKAGVGSSDGGLLLYSYKENPMSFYTNSTERMRITGGGNVGIGTANPLHKLHIYSVENQPLYVEQKFSYKWAECIIAHNSSLSSGQHYSLCIGYSDTTKNRGMLSYYHNGEGSDNNRFCLGLHGVDDVVNVLGNGRVGIGTTSPRATLEVRKDFGSGIASFIDDQHSAQLQVGNKSNEMCVAIGMTSDNYGVIQSKGYGITSQGKLAINPIGGEVYVGSPTSTSSYYKVKLTVNGNIFTDSVNIKTTSSDYDLNIKGNGCVYGSSSDAYWWSKGSKYQIGFGIGSGNVNRGIYGYTEQKWLIRFDASNTCIDYGNVGIGTTSPSHKLHVVGNTYLNGDVFADDLNTYDVIPRSNNFFSCGNSSSRWYQVYGNIGDFSGAVNMGSTLDVTGMTTMTNATITGYLRLKDTTNYGRAIYFGDGEFCYLEEASDDVMTIYANAGIKLNTSSTSYNVSINTNLLVSGGITMYSQRSLKNIQDERGLSLGELRAIKPIRYTWKDGRDNRLHFGGIADDIQQVLPEVVYKTNDGVLTMDYGNAAFAIASSLIQPVVDHEKRIAMLEEENKQLRQEVERLKSA